MQQQKEQISEQQKQAWNHVSLAWKKWDQFIMDFLRPMGDAIIERLGINEDDIVLDIAAGTGEPGLTIAALAKKGKVVGSDLSEEMLMLASENASTKGLTNYSTQVANVCELPFADDTFTAISCRMGFMFFPDMQLAANEIYRVLKPGGRVAISVWSAPEKNFWYTAMTSVIKKHIEVPPVIPGGPGMFRCANPGLMIGIFEKAGFTHVGDKDIDSKVDFVDAENYWLNRTELSESVIVALSNADETTVAAIKNDTYALINANSVDGRALLDYGVNIVYGQKP
ncbi:MAG: class I SAM-dependent methyltransferase [Sphingobacteriales bacterium]